MSPGGSTTSRYGFHLEEVSKSAGIDFTHQAPKLDPKLDHIMPQIASMGASVAVADFDRDGWHDFYTTDSGEGSAEPPLSQPAATARSATWPTRWASPT